MRSLKSAGMELISGHLVEPSPTILQFLEYWSLACRGKSMPTRNDIDPLEIPQSMQGDLFLTEVVDGGNRFKFKFVGREATLVVGKILAGKYVDEINPSVGYAEYISNLYRLTMCRRRPIFSSTKYIISETDSRTTQRLMCPISLDDDIVTMVISCQVFDGSLKNWENVTLTDGRRFENVCEAVIL